MTLKNWCSIQALLGFIPIAAVAVDLNLKSSKLVSHLMRRIAIAMNFQESTTILNARTKKIWKLIVCTSYIYVCVCVYKRVSVRISILLKRTRKEECMNFGESSFLFHRAILKNLLLHICFRTKLASAI